MAIQSIRVAGMPSSETDAFEKALHARSSNTGTTRTHLPAAKGRLKLGHSVMRVPGYQYKNNVFLVCRMMTDNGRVSGCTRVGRRCSQSCSPGVALHRRLKRDQSPIRQRVRPEGALEESHLLTPIASYPLKPLGRRCSGSSRTPRSSGSGMATLFAPLSKFTDHMMCSQAEECPSRSTLLQGAAMYRHTNNPRWIRASKIQLGYPGKHFANRHCCHCGKIGTWLEQGGVVRGLRRPEQA
ncbi:hypothetical protein LXA43DRAFT_444790 [Ganoderma leucocontextum]|nr:hypothetical protein LXA43DRAFT_444790 [Ganoderma leucocontextum]